MKKIGILGVILSLTILAFSCESSNNSGERKPVIQNENNSNNHSQNNNDNNDSNENIDDSDTILNENNYINDNNLGADNNLIDSGDGDGNAAGNGDGDTAGGGDGDVAGDGDGDAAGDGDGDTAGDGDGDMAGDGDGDPSSPLVINHNSVALFDSIPDQYITAVKGMIIHLVGQSHGKQLPHGLELLAALGSTYAVQISTDLDSLTDTNALKVLRSQRTQYNSWTGNSVNESIYWSTSEGILDTERTASFAISEGKAITASIWTWCWDICRPSSFFSIADDFTDDHIAMYLNALDGFNANSAINQTKFIYHTSVTDCKDYLNPDGPWRVTYFNNKIREHITANNMILFDQADLENWSIDNTSQNIATDGSERTIYPRHSDYGEDDASGNADGIPDYAEGHTNDALCLRKAKALWVMLAQMAGWDGN